MSLPEFLQPIAGAFRTGLQRALGSKLVGLYFYGAAVFPDGGVVQDIDFHVILAAALSEHEKHALQALHAELARDFPGQGDDLDGYYVLLADARQLDPPWHQFIKIRDESWALHCAHIRAGRCATLYGPDPLTIYPAPGWPELDRALQGELNYLRGVMAQYPAYAVLNLSRLMYSYLHQDVVISKHASAAWAKQQYPAWAVLIDAALAVYARSATNADRELLQAQTPAYEAFAAAIIAAL